jgi:hypothetical protein
MNRTEASKIYDSAAISAADQIVNMTKSTGDTKHCNERGITLTWEEFHAFCKISFISGCLAVDRARERT